MQQKISCPLCQSRPARPFAQVRAFDYLRCDVCRLTYMHPAQRPTPREERERYSSHRNDPGDERYRAFLGRLATPLLARLPERAEGLDYGCGPGPTLSLMFEEKGFDMWLFDPFFANDPDVLGRSFDFITCSETVEHFFNPGLEFQRLNGMLRNGGWLGVMTQLQEYDESFSNWHYVRDPTHVCFYHVRTMEWIAREHGWAMEMPQKNVVLFHKP